MVGNFEFSAGNKIPLVKGESKTGLGIRISLRHPGQFTPLSVLEVFACLRLQLTSQIS